MRRLVKLCTEIRATYELLQKNVGVIRRMAWILHQEVTSFGEINRNANVSWKKWKFDGSSERYESSPNASSAADIGFRQKRLNYNWFRSPT
jgi:hypothetical protein